MHSALPYREKNKSEDLTCISLMILGSDNPNISQPGVHISVPLSVPFSSLVLFCSFLILLYILFQQADGVTPLNCRVIVLYKQM